MVLNFETPKVSKHLILWVSIATMKRNLVTFGSFSSSRRNFFVNSWWKYPKNHSWWPSSPNRGMYLMGTLDCLLISTNASKKFPTKGVVSTIISAVWFAKFTPSWCLAQSQWNYVIGFVNHSINLLLRFPHSTAQYKYTESFMEWKINATVIKCKVSSVVERSFKAASLPICAYFCAPCKLDVETVLGRLAGSMFSISTMCLDMSCFASERVLLSLKRLESRHIHSDRLPAGGSIRPL